MSFTIKFHFLFICTATQHTLMIVKNYTELESIASQKSWWHSRFCLSIWYNNHMYDAFHWNHTHEHMLLTFTLQAFNSITFFHYNYFNLTFSTLQLKYTIIMCTTSLAMHVIIVNVSLFSVACLLLCLFYFPMYFIVVIFWRVKWCFDCVCIMCGLLSHITQRSYHCPFN